MTKLEFLNQLRKQLSGLPEDDLAERLTFYSEMIDDRMEEGLSEQDAVSSIGSAAEIAAQITADIPHSPSKKEKKKVNVWLTVLLILGSPVWLSLLIALFAVILSLYISLWSIIISLWAVFGSLVVCALAGIVAGIGFIIGGKVLTGITVIGAGLVCGGLSIFLFYGCLAASRGTVLLTKKLVLWVLHRFSKKEGA